ncbi:methanethiol oxidase-like [Oppia nitens]|uniref:methanethiol oxidase-like n=1 Tax=Oppia nitens TaxID=1686743 RepID=UPI0023DC9AA8|nr:methanethiol oxidase-like [Oppia nitens]
MKMSCRETGPGYRSPFDAMRGPRETLMYVTCIQPNGTRDCKSDYLATIDVDPNSSQFCQVICRTLVPYFGDELHHSGWNSCSSCFNDMTKCRNRLICATLNSDRIYVFDMTSLKQPKLFKVIQSQEMHRNRVSSGHTSHCLPSNEIMISCMGDEKRNNKGSFILLDGNSFNIKGNWNLGDNNSSQFGYDFWYQTRHNVMISSEWGSPNTFNKGFKLEDVSNNLYGHSIHVWNWTTKQCIQTIDLGSDGVMPLEIRFLHNPISCEGFVGCALSSTVFRFFKSNDKWLTQKVISIATKKVNNWLLPEMPALITDILVSLDDRYLYISLWLFGEVRQYDISVTSKPVLVGKCLFGGSLCNDGLVFVINSQEPEVEPNGQRERVLVKNKVIKGGPQMLQLSLDGHRLYITNSLYSVWDKQFYPDMVDQGSAMLMIDVDTQKGGLNLNKNFLVDFGKEEFGPVLAHEMRYPGGDCTSDIWI